MTLENKLNLQDQASLARAEEEISKRKAKEFFDSGDIQNVAVGTYAGLALNILPYRTHVGVRCENIMNDTWESEIKMARASKLLCDLLRLDTLECNRLID